MLGAIVARSALITVLTLRPFGAFGPLSTIGSIIVAVARTALLLLHRRTIIVARFHHFVFGFLIAILIAALTALLVIPRAAFAEHAIIMVGVLQIIFGLDAVAGELRITRHALVFFQKLGGVAALAIVLAIAVRPAGNVARRLSSTAAAAVALLSIVDQILILMPQAPDLAGPDTASTEAADLFVPACGSMAPRASRPCRCRRALCA